MTREYWLSVIWTAQRRTTECSNSQPICRSSSFIIPAFLFLTLISEPSQTESEPFLHQIKTSR
jgi:hypothetical protein